MTVNDRETQTGSGTRLPHNGATDVLPNCGRGLPLETLETRLRLGPGATPEQVAEDIRGRGLVGVTVEEVRSLWDEGHLPVG